MTIGAGAANAAMPPQTRMPTRRQPYATTIAQSGTTQQQLARLRQEFCGPLTDEQAANHAALVEIEKQCASHKRHPAEWDAIQQRWLEPQAPASPYYIAGEGIKPPKRAREVICELMAAGLPLSEHAHNGFSNAAEHKAFVEDSDILLRAARNPLDFLPHIAAVDSLGVMLKEHMTYVKAVQQQLRRGALPYNVIPAVEKDHALIKGSMQMSHLMLWVAVMKDTAYDELLAKQSATGPGFAPVPPAGPPPPTAPSPPAPTPPAPPKPVAAPAARDAISPGPSQPAPAKSGAAAQPAKGTASQPARPTAAQPAKSTLAQGAKGTGTTQAASGASAQAAVTPAAQGAGAQAARASEVQAGSTTGVPAAGGQPAPPKAGTGAAAAAARGTPQHNSAPARSTNAGATQPTSAAPKSTASAQGATQPNSAPAKSTSATQGARTAVIANRALPASAILNTATALSGPRPQVYQGAPASAKSSAPSNGAHKPQAAPQRASQATPQATPQAAAKATPPNATKPAPTHATAPESAPDAASQPAAMQVQPTKQVQATNEASQENDAPAEPESQVPRERSKSMRAAARAAAAKISASERSANALQQASAAMRTAKAATAAPKGKSAGSSAPSAAAPSAAAPTAGAGAAATTGAAAASGGTVARSSSRGATAALQPAASADATSQRKAASKALAADVESRPRPSAEAPPPLATRSLPAPGAAYKGGLQTATTPPAQVPSVAEASSTSLSRPAPASEAPRVVPEGPGSAPPAATPPPTTTPPPIAAETAGPIPTPLNEPLPQAGPSPVAPHAPRGARNDSIDVRDDAVVLEEPTRDVANMLRQVGSFAEKCAQFLQSYYQQEHKDLQMRTAIADRLQSSGVSTGPYGDSKAQATAPSTSAAMPRYPTPRVAANAAPSVGGPQTGWNNPPNNGGGVDGAPSAQVGAPIPVRSVAPTLPRIPPGASWGYMMHGLFYPVDLIGHFASFVPTFPTEQPAVGPSVHEQKPLTSPQPSSLNGQAAPDLNELELEACYRPALWNPTKVEVQEMCWTRYRQQFPDAQRSKDMKHAQVLFNTVKTEIRENYYGKLEIRQQLREVCLFVLERIQSGAFTPTGSLKKAVDGIRKKLEKLSLPPRVGEAHPKERLLQWDRAFQAALNAKLASQSTVIDRTPGQKRPRSSNGNAPHGTQSKAPRVGATPTYLPV